MSDPELRATRRDQRERLRRAAEEGGSAALVEAFVDLQADHLDEISNLGREIRSMADRVASIVEASMRQADAMEADMAARRETTAWIRGALSSRWGVAVVTLALLSQGIGSAVLIGGAAYLLGVRGVVDLVTHTIGPSVPIGPN